MRSLVRNVHVFAAALLPALVSGTLYLPSTPPPFDHMLRLAALGLAIATGCVLVPGPRADSAARRAVIVSLSIATVLAYPLVSTLAQVVRLSRADAVFGILYTGAAVLGLRYLSRLSSRVLDEFRSTLNLV